MTELKPCPFCGGEAEVCEGGINGRMQVYGLVEHKDGCFFIADGLPTKMQHIMEKDFTAWNTRAERTCHYVGDEISGGCSECRGWLDPDCAYCPNCGAKVVS